MPPASEMALAPDALRERFAAQLKSQGGIVHQVAGYDMVRAKLMEICRQEGVVRAMAAEDELMAALELKAWATQSGIAVTFPGEHPDRQAYTRVLFDEVQAGVTGADYAVAESGTLVLVHNTRQARLISLAPLIHIAVVPLTRIVPTYESAMTAIFNTGRPPSQVTLITGPSMTADIQATPFKGMHGPQKLFVMLMA